MRDREEIHSSHKLSEEFRRLSDLCTVKSALTFQELIDSLPQKSHGLITLFMALPFCTPIPMPGLSIVFGICIAVIGMRLAIGKGPWLPARILQKKISSSVLKKVFDLGQKIMLRFEVLVRPRGEFICRQKYFVMFTGSLICFCGLLLAAPLPPGTNFPPAISIVLLSVAVLEHDAVVMVLGYIVFVLNILFFVALFLIGYEGVKTLFGL